MKKTKELSGAELEVMQILWKNDGPMTVQDVCDQLKSSKWKWKYRTVATLLLRMKEKDAVACVKEHNDNIYTCLLYTSRCV